MLLVVFQYVAFVIEGIEGLLGDEDAVAAAAILGQGNAELAAAVEQEDTATADVGAAGTVTHDTLHTGERRQP
jgi:hypothetical protein